MKSPFIMTSKILNSSDWNINLEANKFTSTKLSYIFQPLLQF